MRATVERALGGWKPAPGQPAAPPPVPGSPLPPPPPPGRVFLVDRPGLTQARLRPPGARAVSWRESKLIIARCTCVLVGWVESSALLLRCVRSGKECPASMLDLTAAKRAAPCSTAMSPGAAGRGGHGRGGRGCK